MARPAQAVLYAFSTALLENYLARLAIVQRYWSPSCLILY